VNSPPDEFFDTKDTAQLLYCVYADRAVEILRANGRRARRLLDGFPEWRAAGLPIATGPQPGAAI
jgi:hypothetical protein